MNHETAVSNAKEIADRILAPAARQNDKDARFSSEAVAALGPAGLLGIMLPTEVGGAARGPRPVAAVIATLAEADAPPRPSRRPVRMRRWRRRSRTSRPENT
jgi:alkylation response protein AidB-like acyl-CoA dehydrogenase